MFEHFVGNSMARCLKIAEDMLGQPVPEGFENVYRVRIQAALAQGLLPMRGIEQRLIAASSHAARAH